MNFNIKINSIKTQLYFALVLGGFSMISIIVAFYWSDLKKQRIHMINNKLQEVNSKFLKANLLEKDFFTFETINPEFHETGNSDYLKTHKQIFDAIEEDLIGLKKYKEVQEDHLFVSKINQINSKIELFNVKFDSITGLILERGFKDHGAEGKMRSHIHNIEHADLPDFANTILTIRRHEKDYIIRKQEKYISKLNKTISQLVTGAQEKIKTEKDLNYLLIEIDNYHKSFREIVDLERKIGVDDKTGMRFELTMLSQEIDQLIALFITRFRSQSQETLIKVRLILILFVGIIAILSIVIIYLVAKQLGDPIQKLSNSIEDVINSNFSINSNIAIIDKDNELGIISRDVHIMVEKVREQTAKVMKEHQEAQNAYNNVVMLENIGRNITSNLSAKSILENTYKKIKYIIPTDLMMIGIYNEETKLIDTLEITNEDPTVVSGTKKVEPNSSFSGWCLINEKPILVDDISKGGYRQFLDKDAFSDEDSSIYQSVLYVPIQKESEAIGVFAVKSKQKAAYKDNNLNFLKNLALYCSIAVDNSKSFKKIGDQNDEIQSMMKIIQNKNKSITDSIRYAERIQKSMLPSSEEIGKYLPDHFIYYKPKDIVSGDFYWFREVDGNLIIAAVDCTGHGVPGAIMSMIGDSLLKAIVVSEKIADAGEILNRMHQGVINALNQVETSNNDGMDMVICIINNEKKVMQFAGAHNPLLLFQNGRYQKIKGNRMPIGGIQYGVERTFEKHELDISVPTSFYLISDGIQDQFGGPNKKKFSSKRLETLLQAHYEKSMKEQGTIVHDTLNDWINYDGKTHRQMDDLMLLGIRI